MISKASAPAFLRAILFSLNSEFSLFFKKTATIPPMMVEITAPRATLPQMSPVISVSFGSCLIGMLQAKAASPKR